MKLEIESQDLETLADILAEKVFAKLKILIFHQDYNNNQLMTVEQLADYLHVEKHWIYQHVHAQDIPYVKVGAKLRFLKSEIDKWIKKR